MIVNTSISKVSTVVIPSFDTFAKSIVSVQRQADAASIKASTSIVQNIQKFLDSCAVADVPRTGAGVKALGKAIRECQVFVDAVAVGYFEKKTITEYAQGAMRAYFHSVEFSPTLKNDPDFKIPGTDGKVKTNGSVRTTDNEAVFKTARKLLDQLRILERDDCAANILDVMLGAFDGFAEVESSTI